MLESRPKLTSESSSSRIFLTINNLYKNPIVFIEKLVSGKEISSCSTDQLMQTGVKARHRDRLDSTQHLM